MLRLDRTAAEPWLAMAEADLAVTRLVLERQDATSEMLGLACFHSQQAAEKAIKAVLMALDLPAPRTHDVGLLAQNVPVVLNMPMAVLAACEALSDFGVGPRYPLPGRLVVRVVAERAAVDGLTVCRWVNTIIGT